MPGRQDFATIRKGAIMPQSNSIFCPAGPLPAGLSSAFTLPLLIFISFATSAWAQTVQLPTQRVFSVGTTVLVPDRGSASLGGVSHARESAVTRGFGAAPLLGNRGSGREFGQSGASISAYVIDHRELDRQVLAAAGAAQNGSDVDASGDGGDDGARRRLAFAAYLSQHMGTAAAAPCIATRDGAKHSRRLVAQREVR